MRSTTSALAATLFFVSAGAFASASVVAQLRPPADALEAAPAPAQEAPADPAIAQKESDARLSAQGWLVLLDRRDWGRSWETTSSVFRKLVPLGGWMDGIPKVRDPLGAFVERKIVESAYKTTLAGHPDGEYVTVIFQSKFANKPEVIEAVTTVLEKDGKWRVTGYSAQ
jgi:hypothetical protein